MNTEEENNRRMRIKNEAKTKNNEENNKVGEKARECVKDVPDAKRSRMKTKI